MKKYSPTNFSSPLYNIFLTVAENKSIAWNYCFSRLTSIYLFKFSNVNTRIKCKICLKLTIEAPDVLLVSLLLTWIYLTHCSSVFCWVWTWMGDGKLYCLNLNLSLYFRVRSRTLLTFKTKFYVTTVNKNFQRLPILLSERAPC